MTAASQVAFTVALLAPLTLPAQTTVVAAPVTTSPVLRAAPIIQLVDSLAAADQFSGSVLVLHGDSVVLQRHAGLADREAARPVDGATRFNVASLGKMFTATVIAQLEAEGRLRFDDPVAKHIPEYPNRNFAERATIHHLLTHTSGLGAYPFFRAPERVADYLPLFSGDSLPFAPGERFRYSNAGYVLLGLIIERLTGEVFQTAVAQRVFTRAAMSSAGYPRRGAWDAHTVVSYTEIGRDGRVVRGARRETRAEWEPRGGPAGGALMNAADLARFARALAKGGLVSPTSFATMSAGRVDFPAGRYGYGIGVETDRAAHRIWGHDGFTPGAGAVVNVYPELDVTVVILTNMDLQLGAAVIKRAIRDQLAF